MLIAGHFSGGRASLAHGSRMSLTYEADLLPMNRAWTACSKPTGPWPPPALLTRPCLTPPLPAAQPAPLAAPVPGRDDEMVTAGVARDLAGADGEHHRCPLQPRVLGTRWLWFGTKKDK